MSVLKEVEGAQKEWRENSEELLKKYLQSFLCTSLKRFMVSLQANEDSYYLLFRFEPLYNLDFCICMLVEKCTESCWSWNRPKFYKELKGEKLLVIILVLVLLCRKLLLSDTNSNEELQGSCVNFSK